MVSPNSTGSAKGCVGVPGACPYMVIVSPIGEHRSIDSQSQWTTRFGSICALPVVPQNFDSTSWGTSDCISNVPAAMIHYLVPFVHRSQSRQALFEIPYYYIVAIVLVVLSRYDQMAVEKEGCGGPALILIVSFQLNPKRAFRFYCFSNRRQWASVKCCGICWSCSLSSAEQ